MTFKFKLTRPITDMGEFSPTRSCPEYLRDLLKSQSRLVSYTPQAIHHITYPSPVLDADGNCRAGTDWYEDIWEYELTERQQQMMDAVGARIHHIWQGLQGHTDYVNTVYSKD